MKRTVALLLIVTLIASCGKFARVINSANSSGLNLANSDDNSSLGTVAENAENNDANFSVNSANSSGLNLANSDDNSSLGTVAENAENNDVNFSVNSANSSGLNLVNSDDNSSPGTVVENAENNDANPFILELEELLNNITAMEATWTDAENGDANLINPEEE
ncbi:MAG: hypothetical protein LE169_00415 [Endomicrobium sp.]|nr:hypothetical protein [Endomicrobium sp.]